MRRLLFASALLAVLSLGLAGAAQAQDFGPKTYAECVMVTAKRAASSDGAMLLRRACKCRFQDPKDSDCRKYSTEALDCLVANLASAENNDAAWGVERACRLKNPVK